MKYLCQIADHKVYKFQMPVILSNMYIIVGENEAIVIDPCISESAGRLLNELNITKCKILLTHEHFDHISGVNWLKELCDCRILCSENCSKVMCNPNKNGAKTFGALFLDRDSDTRNIVDGLWSSDYGCYSDDVYVDDLLFQWQDLKIYLKEAPGHSKGGALILINDKYLFTGDNYIPGEEVITRLPGGSKKDYLEKTMPLLDKYIQECCILPGHG